ncbi:YlaF family protein [Fervidibacillus halotolerans]|uniref:YlaF family protein n=1 Tax=Fervidibacillus halotolerans TaxID=2980027 RepID=A0A9E8RYW1_9BACI|nr:YlaF family protein [Fervidibacillus halotolerans]WAA13246.1 YlaF family protein [Fervidibacillus halotolerans]
MKQGKWIFLLYAILAVLSMVAIGVSVGLRNPYLIVLFTLILIFIMGIGFLTKKKYREAGKL